MSDDTITIHQIGGDDLIASLRDRDWNANPDEVKQLAQEVRRLRATLEDTDIIDDRTVMRIEVDFREVFRSSIDGVAGQCLIITAPNRLERNQDFGAIVAGGVQDAIHEFMRRWVEASKETTGANS